MKKISAITLSFIIILTCFTGCDFSLKDLEIHDVKKSVSQSYTKNRVITNAGIPSEKIWRVYTDNAFKPFEFKDYNGSLVGIEIDILKAVSEDIGFKYSLKESDFDTGVSECKAGNGDVLMAGASITKERQSSGWRFSDGYFNATLSMAVQKGSSIKGLKDIKGKTVVVTSGTESEKYAERLVNKYNFYIAKVPSSLEAYEMVINGGAVACFDDTAIIQSYIKDKMLNLNVLKNTETKNSQYGVAVFNDDNMEFLEMFNKGLKDIKASGKYDEIIKKYLG